MRRGGSPTLVCAIDNVVVNEGAGLVELECGTQVGEKHLAERKPGAQSLADVSHEGAKALAARRG